MIFNHKDWFCIHVCLSFSNCPITVPSDVLQKQHKYFGLHQNKGCYWQRQEQNRLTFQVLLKNLPPFFPIPVPTRLVARTDLESGLHFSSFRTENKVDMAGETTSFFMLLHETTARLCKSFQDNTTDSRPSVVNKEQPSRQRNFTLLQRIQIQHNA